MSVVSTTSLAQASLDLSAKESQTRLAKKIAAYLVHSRRSREVDALAREMRRLQAVNGIVEATVTSAFALAPETLKQLKQLLTREFSTAKTLVINEVVDPALIGGLRVDVAGKQLDTSIATKLHKLKHARS